MIESIKIILGLGIASTLFITIYNFILKLYYGNNYSCFDILNIKLGNIFNYNFCLWNLSHILIFYFFCKIIKAEYNIYLHLLVFLFGVLWLVIAPYSKKGNKCDLPGKINKIVYSDIYNPRLDDLIFNSLGQILYLILLKLYIFQ